MKCNEMRGNSQSGDEYLLMKTYVIIEYNNIFLQMLDVKDRHEISKNKLIKKYKYNDIEYSRPC